MISQAQNLSPEQALAALRDFVARTTHWREGGTDRHTALYEALPLLEDHLEWLEKGVSEWRGLALRKGQHLNAVQATARVAIGHLNAVLNEARNADEQQKADTAARDWLDSIGN